LQKWVSINLNNHAPDSEKPRWPQIAEKPHQENLKSLYIGVHIRVDMGVNIRSKTKRRETYWARWYRNHPRISIYLNREEYEILKKLSDELGLSYKDIMLNAIDATEKIKKTYNEAYEKAIQNIINAEVNEEKLREYGVQYLHCTICGKPLEGYIIPINGTFPSYIRYLTIKHNIHHSYHDKVTKHV